MEISGVEEDPRRIGADSKPFVDCPRAGTIHCQNGMSQVNAQTPAGDGAILGSKQKEARAGDALFRDNERMDIAVKDGTCRRARRPTRRGGNGHRQRLRRSLIIIEGGQSAAIVRDPERSARSRRDAPGVGQVRIGKFCHAGEVGNQVGPLIEATSRIGSRESQARQHEQGKREGNGDWP